MRVTVLVEVEITTSDDRVEVTADECRGLADKLIKDCIASGRCEGCFSPVAKGINLRIANVFTLTRGDVVQCEGIAKADRKKMMEQANEDAADGD